MANLQVADLYQERQKELELTLLAGAKGMRRGDIQVADYHANLIYNDGAGTSGDFRFIVDELKRRVADKFGISPEEEVQYVG